MLWPRTQKDGRISFSYDSQAWPTPTYCSIPSRAPDLAFNSRWIHVAMSNNAEPAATLNSNSPNQLNGRQKRQALCIQTETEIVLCVYIYIYSISIYTSDSLWFLVGCFLFIICWFWLATKQPCFQQLHGPLPICRGKKARAAWKAYAIFGWEKRKNGHCVDSCRISRGMRNGWNKRLSLPPSHCWCQMAS